MTIHIALAVLCLTVGCRKRSDTSTSFLDLSKDKINYVVKDGSITLKSATGDLNDCKPYFAWRNKGDKD